MSDITKVREMRSKDDGDWGKWPYPTVEIESVISGELRSRILSKLGYEDDGRQMLLVEREVSGGWSEFTQEDECSIEVRVGSVEAWQAGYELSRESAMQRFLKEFG